MISVGDGSKTTQMDGGNLIEALGNRCKYYYCFVNIFTSVYRLNPSVITLSAASTLTPLT